MPWPTNGSSHTACYKAAWRHPIIYCTKGMEIKMPDGVFVVPVDGWFMEINGKVASVWFCPFCGHDLSKRDTQPGPGIRKGPVEMVKNLGDTIKD